MEQEMTRPSLRSRLRIKRLRVKTEKKALSSDMRTLLDRFEADYDNRRRESDPTSRSDRPTD